MNSVRIIFPNLFANLNFVSRNFPPIRRITLMMTIRSYTSASDYQEINSKRIKLTIDDYHDLNELLSDSDGWDDEGSLEVDKENHRGYTEIGNKSKDGHLRKKIRTEFSDEDDSIIYHMFESGSEGLIKEKVLAGASRKLSRDLPPRNSFSSHILERPIVESTQHGNFKSAVADGDDSKLLISILKGSAQANVSEESHKATDKGRDEQSPLDKLYQSHAGEKDTKGMPLCTSSLLAIQGKQASKYPGVINLRNEKQIVTQKSTIPELHEEADKIKKKDSVNIFEDDICIVGERKCLKLAEEEDSTSTPSLSHTFDQSKEKDDCVQVNEQKEKMQYSEKFALLTQRPCLQDLQELEKKINLRSNTKIVIPLRLSKEQEDVLHLAEEGHNIFYTGSAGTGKSVLLREMIKTLKKKYGIDGVAVTASTGLAACNVGGITVHSFAGVGLGNGDVKKLYQKVKRSQKFVKRWQNISALVVDEISMLDGELLDKLDFIAQKIRKNSKPFGDIQLILCGDFFQLPPVSKDHSKPMKFAFESLVWKEAIDVTIALRKVFRQQGDTKFIEMLNNLRLGRIDNETEIEFKKLSRPLPQDDIIPAELYSTRNEVDRANNSRLNRLPGKANIYQAIDGGILEDKEMKERLLQNFLAPKQLQLKIGAQVMMIKNIDATLVNGSLGKVIDFIDHETYMFYDTMKANPEIGISELERLKANPDILRETWNDNLEEPEAAVRQKSTKDAFCKSDPNSSENDLGESIFDFLDDVSTTDVGVKYNLQRKVELLKEIHASSKRKRKLPLVRFKTSDMSTRTVLVEPEDWAIEDENEKPLVSRVQLPLMLAWSLSIHKSQGQTLPKVKVDLRRVFEKGQAYVALSRAVSREGLQVLNFDKARIMAHDKVVDFYSTLVTVEEARKQIDGSSQKHGRRINDRRDSAAPTKPLLVKKSRAARSRSNTPNPASGMDRITEMLMRRSNRG